MPDSTTPSTAAPAPDVDRAAEDLALRSLEALESQTTSTFQSANNFNDLLRIATRHIRRLVDCELARIWVTRSGGRRLVAREFPGDREGVPIERRMARAEGLAGLSVTNEQPLRLAPGEAPPKLQGETPEFTSALVMPLFRRGDAFGRSPTPTSTASTSPRSTSPSRSTTPCSTRRRSAARSRRRCCSRSPSRSRRCSSWTS